MAKHQSSGLFALGEAKILNAIGLGALLGTVSMGIGLLAGTISVAAATATLAMGTAAVVGIAAMVGSAILERKSQQTSQQQHAPVVVIQAQGIAQSHELEQPGKGKFVQMIEAERALAESKHHTRH